MSLDNVPPCSSSAARSGKDALQHHYIKGTLSDEAKPEIDYRHVKVDFESVLRLALVCSEPLVNH